MKVNEILLNFCNPTLFKKSLFMKSKLSFLSFFFTIILQNSIGQSCSWNTEGVNLPCCNLSNQIYIPTEAPLCNNNPWILKFEDNFDGESINSVEWFDRLPWGDMLPPYPISLPENVILNNGMLYLYLKQENNWHCVPFFFSSPPNCLPPECCYPYYYNYSGALIWSKKEYKYGKFEIRCKIPNGNGFWPAFWLYGGSPWNEIDVFEFNNHSTTRHIMTYHYDLNDDGDTKDNNEQCRGDYEGPDFSSTFHIFTLIWDEFKIEWYVDDTLKRRITKYHSVNTLNGITNPVDCNDIQVNHTYFVEEHNFPNHPMSIIINAFTQSGEYAPDATTVLPALMEVDYIRVWQKETYCCTSYKLYESTENLPTLTSVDNYIIAGNDAGISDASGNVVVKNGQTVSFKAGDYIDLKSGFEVEKGANFSAEISPCTVSQGDNIEIISFPDSFTPDNDGIDDKLMISVNGATSYKIRVEDKDPPYNTFYQTGEISIFSNPVAVWDGSCNYTGNCWFYHTCDRQRRITLTFYNCDNMLISQKVIDVDCNSKSLIIEEENADNEQGSDKSLNYNGEIVNFQIHPNPFSNSFTISFTQPEQTDAKIYLTDAYGRQVLSIFNGSIDKGQHSIDVSTDGITKGLYFCIMETPSGRNVVKVVKTE